MGYCTYYKIRKECKSSKIVNYLSLNCAKTCGYCKLDNKYKVIQAEDCVNLNSNCPKLVEQGHCKNPYSKRYMSKNCQESCSLCNLKLEKKEQSKIYITATAKIKNSSTVSEHLTTEKINE